MLACVDAHYSERATAAARILFRRWDDCQPADEQAIVGPLARPYRPGHFYERELPALLAVLGDAVVDAVIVDGHVWLADQLPGLGAHLHEVLGGRIAVVGVAKRRYRGSTFARPVLRGKSGRPLWVTAAGMDPALAASAIQGMAGAHRIPDLLRRVDALARRALAGGG